MAQTAQPELERHVSSASVRSGARLLRGTSQLFTGSADGNHHDHELAAAPAAPTENTPLTESSPPVLIRQQSQVAMQTNLTQDQVQQRIITDATDVFTRNVKWIVLAAVTFFVLMITMIVVFVLALCAVINFHDKPCDQPLKYYAVVLVLWNQVPGQIQQCIANESWTWKGKMALLLVLAVPGWCIIGWGVYMITEIETCPKTNPGLYYPTRNFIFVQVFFAAIALVTTTCMALGARRLMVYAAHLMEGPSCSDAVHALPKIAGGAPELVADDGEVKACPICLDALSVDAVKTPCTHYFHEGCLANWCASHLDCPLCRQAVGEPDEKKGDDRV